MTDRRTDRRTDKEMDGRTNKIKTPKTALAQLRRVVKMTITSEVSNNSNST